MRKVLYILTRLSDEDVDWMATVGKRKRLPAGTVLIREGQPIEALTFVLDGVLSVTAEGVGEITRLGRGDILGEMSLVDESPPSATVTVLEPTTVLSIDRRMLDAKTSCDPCFAARLYRAIAMFLSVRMRATVKRLGYGPAAPSTHDEIEAEMREDMRLAGVRLERMLKQLMASALRS